MTFVLSPRLSLAARVALKSIAQRISPATLDDPRQAQAFLENRVLLFELFNAGAYIARTDGSEFTADLPLLACEPAPSAPEVPPRLHHPTGPALGRPVPTMQEQAAQSPHLILVAEDNATNRDVIQEQLRLLGYACELAEDGVAALALWQAKPAMQPLGGPLTTIWRCGVRHHRAPTHEP
jgi:hypothetical protein